MRTETSWGGEAIIGEYQKNLILPNLLRLLAIKKNETILDLGCGSGFFAREFARKGAKVIGVDISKELIEIARKLSPKNIQYFVASANDLHFLKEKSIDKITIILTIQNLDNVHAVLKENYRVLKPGGEIFLVMTHPAFRVPKESSWEWDEKNKVQYRRVDSYLSESKVKIQMHPGEKPSAYTVTFHRPLQFYFKNLGNNGFCLNRLEEWISPKKSEPGPRAAAENYARKEIPLFLFLEAMKV